MSYDAKTQRALRELCKGARQRLEAALSALDAFEATLSTEGDEAALGALAQESYVAGLAVREIVARSIPAADFPFSRAAPLIIGEI